MENVMWSAIKLLWLRTEDKDLHPRAPELLGITRHWILRFAICDDHQHFGKTVSGAGRLTESISQNVVQSITWTNEREKSFTSLGVLRFKL